MVNDDPSSSPVEKLVDYLDKNEGLRDRCGCQLDDIDKERFIDETRDCDMGRLLTLSPENTDLTDQELSRATRDTMAEYLQGKYSAEYIMAIHRDTENPHTQVAVAGNDEDLHMDKEGIERLQESALEQFNEQEIGLVQMQLDGRELDDDVAEQHSESLKIANLDDQWRSSELEQSKLDTSRSRGKTR